MIARTRVGYPSITGAAWLMVHPAARRSSTHAEIPLCSNDPPVDTVRRNGQRHEPDKRNQQSTNRHDYDIFRMLNLRRPQVISSLCTPPSAQYTHRQISEMHVLILKSR